MTDVHKFPEGYPSDWIDVEDDMPPNWYIAFALSGIDNISDQILKKDLSKRFPELTEDKIDDAVRLGKTRVIFILSNGIIHAEKLFG